MVRSLDDRIFGYEMSGFEYQLIFKHDNMGFVRYMNVNDGTFYLDPSPFLKTQKNEVFMIKPCSISCSMPPKGKLIEVTVLESEKITGMVNKELKSIEVHYVIDWKEVNPNKIRGNKLTTRDDFLDILSIPLKNRAIDNPQLMLCLAMYVVSSPQYRDVEKGGINALVFGNDKVLKKWNVFKHIISVIPPEFRTPSSKFFYKSLLEGENITSSSSEEISLSFLNNRTVPIQLPMNFDVAYRSYSNYKDDLNTSIPIARAYMLDALMFKPEISQSLQKKVKEKLYYVLDFITSDDELPYHQHIGSLITKLSTSYARFNFNNEVTNSDLERCMDVWEDSINSTKILTDTKYNIDIMYKLPESAIILLKEILSLKNIGEPLTIVNISEKTKLNPVAFEEALNKLYDAGYIYYPNNSELDILEI